MDFPEDPPEEAEAPEGLLKALGVLPKTHRLSRGEALDGPAEDREGDLKLKPTWRPLRKVELGETPWVFP